MVKLSSSGFLLSNLLYSLMALLCRPFFHPSMADNIIVFRCSSVIYPHLLLSPSHWPKLFVHVFNEESEWDTSLGFLCERFSKRVENNNHSRIIYRNDNIARLVKT